MAASLLAAIAAAGLVLCGCGTAPAPQQPDPSYTALTHPGTRAPADELERAILEQLARLPADKPTTVAGRSVTAGTAYTAASGRDCRSISVQASGVAAGKALLACKFSKGWSYVPDVVRHPTKADNRKVPQ